MYNTWIEHTKNINRNSSPVYQIYQSKIIWKHEPKCGPTYSRQVDHPRPQTLQRESVVKPGAPLLIILRLVCKSETKEVHGNFGNMYNLFFEEKVCGQKRHNHFTEWQFDHFLLNLPQWMPLKPLDDRSTWILTRYRPALPEPILTLICVTLWCHYVTGFIWP